MRRWADAFAFACNTTRNFYIQEAVNSRLGRVWRHLTTAPILTRWTRGPCVPELRDLWLQRLSGVQLQSEAQYNDGGYPSAAAVRIRESCGVRLQPEAVWQELATITLAVQVAPLSADNYDDSHPQQQRVRVRRMHHSRGLQL